MNHLGILIILIVFVGGCMTTEREKILQGLQTNLEEISQTQNWSPEIKDKIKNHEISIGMNEYQVLASWIEARFKKNRSVGSWGVHEQWVFEGNRYKNYRTTYLYFENGILTSYQD
jgi:hypothetical protein